MTSPFSKKQTLYLLRWVLIIASAYLFFFSIQTPTTPPALALLIAAALLSNLLLSRFPEKWVEGPAFDVTLVLFDTLWVSLGAFLTHNLSGDFFLLYFLVILLAVAGERLEVIAFGAAIIGVIYTGALAFESPSFLFASPTYLLRIPFLFAIALFYGYLVARTRQEHLRADEARQREELKTDLISMVSHDIKNPLTAIQGYVDMLLGGKVGRLNAMQEKMIRRVGANVRRVLALANDFLDLARTEGGGLVLQTEPVQINNVIQEILQQDNDAQTKGITLRYVLDPHLPLVEADERQMGRVVANLLHNAIKFTPAGGSIAVSTQARNSGMVFSVADTGPGITAAELPYVFDKYQEFARLGKSHGSGLGLYIVKALVEAHGGEVSVNSVPGQGTSFHVHLSLSRLSQR
jgi:signal transduction histidine kinase